jgi:hypothetical protein
MVRALQREPDFADLEFRAHWICFVENFSEREANDTLSTNQILKAFGYSPFRVKAELANGLEPPKVRVPHPVIDEGSEAEILEWIESQAEKCNPATRTDLRQHCQAKYSPAISRGWVDSFILRHRDELVEMKSTPQEDARVKVAGIFLDETMRCLGEYVHGMKAELVFNLDEVGVSEWENRKDKKVAILRVLSGQTIHHRASRNLKHMSIITYISIMGESLTPYIMTSQDSESFRRKRMIRGVRLGVDLVL